MNESVAQLTRIVAMAREIVRQDGGKDIPFTLFDLVETQDGFGFTSGSGVALLFADVTDAAPGSWSLQCSAAVAFDVPHRREVGMWINEKNYASVLGRYYYRVSRDGDLSAVIWEMQAWSRLLLDFGGMQGQGALLWLREIMRSASMAATADASECTGRFGGRILAPTEQDAITIFTAASG